jgi:hypothetical protein
MCCRRCYRNLAHNSVFRLCAPCRRLNEMDYTNDYRRVADIVRNMRSGRIAEKDRTNALAFVCGKIEDWERERTL